MTQQFFAAIHNNTTGFVSGNDGLIFGIGHTAAAAIADAISESNPRATEDEFKALPCSEGLYAAVKEQGGQVKFEKVNGRLVLAIEAE